jgi:hypothetical protein
VNITGLANTTAYTLNLPTGSLALTVGTNLSTNYTVGNVKYDVRMGNGTTTAWISVRATPDTTPTAVFTTPGVMVVEGLDEVQSRNVISWRMDSDASYNRVDIPVAPYFTSTKTSTPGVSGTTQNKYVDQFGTYVLYDSTMPGTLSVSYPASQAQAAIAVGKSPSASFGGAGGSVTTDSVLPITADVVKLDSEMTSSDKTANDVVLMGGPCINTLVAELATAGKFQYTCSNWPGRDFGKVQVIADAFASGKTALVIAGTRAQDTDMAAQVVQKGMPGATASQAAGSSVEVTGSVSSPVYAA